MAADKDLRQLRADFSCFSPDFYFIPEILERTMLALAH